MTQQSHSLFSEDHTQSYIKLYSSSFLWKILNYISFPLGDSRPYEEQLYDPLTFKYFYQAYIKWKCPWRGEAGEWDSDMVDGETGVYHSNLLDRKIWNSVPTSIHLQVFIASQMVLYTSSLLLVSYVMKFFCLHSYLIIWFKHHHYPNLSRG